MKSKLLSLLGCVFLALACSGEYEAGVDEAEEFGELEQPIGIGNGGYGVSTGSQRLACSQPGLTGQDCRIPIDTDKIVSYCFDPLMPAAEVTQITAGVELIDTQTNWTFNRITSTTCPLYFQAFSVLGGSGTNMDQYTHPTFSGIITTLTKGTNPPINGSWKSFTKLIIQVDSADVALSSNPPALDFHIGAKGAAFFVGLGTQTDAAHLNSPTRRSVLTAPITTLTSGEICRANNYNGNNGLQTFVGIASTCGV